MIDPLGRRRDSQQKERRVWMADWCLVCAKRVPVKQREGHLLSVGHRNRVGAVDLNRRWQCQPTRATSVEQPQLTLEPEPEGIQTTPPGHNRKERNLTVRQLARRGGLGELSSSEIQSGAGLIPVPAESKIESSHWGWRYVELQPVKKKRKQSRLGPPRRVEVARRSTRRTTTKVSDKQPSDATRPTTRTKTHTAMYTADPTAGSIGDMACMHVGEGSGAGSRAGAEEPPGRQRQRDDRAWGAQPASRGPRRHSRRSLASGRRPGGE
eukprot:SAG31_NODE_358_length_17033_cov_11.747077_7_plen_267_part_00